MSLFSKIFFCITCILPTIQYAMEGKDLSEIRYSAAGVLPFFTNESGTTYVILARECCGHNQGQFDDFGGKKEKDDRYPVQLAAREFCEEAILDKTVGLTETEVEQHIDQNNKYTKFIIAYFLKRSDTYGITYITDFSRYASQFINNFYKFLRKETEPAKKEKDIIALVEWNTFKDAIINSKRSPELTRVNAFVIDSLTNESIKARIPLRPILVSKLKLFFSDKPYEQGADEKIRFYSWDFKKQPTISTSTVMQQAVSKGNEPASFTMLDEIMLHDKDENRFQKYMQQKFIEYKQYQSQVKYVPTLYDSILSELIRTTDITKISKPLLRKYDSIWLKTKHADWYREKYNQSRSRLNILREIE